MSLGLPYIPRATQREGPHGLREGPLEAGSLGLRLFEIGTSLPLTRLFEGEGLILRA
jgi:hypothetical protein